MELLEEKVLGIIELKKQGLDETEIAEKLGLDAKEVLEYEIVLKKGVDKVSRKIGFRLKREAKILGLSLIAFQNAVNYYGLDYKEKKKKLLKKYEQRIEQLKEAAERGLNTKEAAEELGISKRYVYYLAEKGEISLRKNSEKRIEQIRDAFARGLDTKEAAEELGISKSQIYYLAEKGEISLRKKSEKRIEQIEDAFARGLNRQEAAEELGISRSYVNILAKKGGIKIPDKRNSEEYLRQKYGIDSAEREAMLTECTLDGKLLEETGNKLGVTRERARQILKKKGYEDLRIQAKQEIFQNEKERKTYLSIISRQILEAGVENLPEEEKEAGYKILELLDSYKYYSGIDFSKTFELFRAYFNAKRENRKLSLEELEEISGKNFASIGRILKRIGLEPFYGSRERRSPLNSEKKQMIKRTVDIEMNQMDLAHFMGLNYWNIAQFFERNPELKSKMPKQKFDFRFYIGKERKTLGYRHASEVYKNFDENNDFSYGFFREELIELSGLSEKAYDFFIKKRGEIEAKIVSALRIMYPRKNFEKPYL